MAKLLKHLGIGVKKNPPQPPKPDYSGIKTGSTESAIAVSPTSVRSTTSLSTTTSHIGEFEVSQLQGSPHRIVASEKGGGARPKDGGGGVSPKSSTSERIALPSTSGSEEPDAPATGDSEQLEGAVGGSGATQRLIRGNYKPQLLDEYSDPFDLKRQLQEEYLGACAPIMEDDYSVPYEVKKLHRERLRKEGGEGDSPSRSGLKGPRMYPYEEVIGMSPVHRPLMPENLDKRPKEDYEEPWDGSKQKKLLESLESASHIPPHFITNENRTPQLQRTKLTTSGSLDSEPDSDKLPHSMNVSTGAYDVSARTPQQKEEESDDEGYTHLREEFGPTGPTPPRPAGAEKNQRIGNYEEPWDLTAKKKELEEQFIAASDRASREKPVSNIPAPHESDTRTQEGYEKPWDWKPHQKDDRPQEGYEKPWDWKPHQKDDRPPEEYEEPWDQKAEELKQALAKGASKDGNKKEKSTDCDSA